MIYNHINLNFLKALFSSLQAIWSEILFLITMYEEAI